MPVLDPRDNGYKPRGWRYAYDALTNLKVAVAKYHVSTMGWKLIVPSRFKGYADPRWQLQFVNIDGKLDTYYIGSDAMTAKKTIDEIRRNYVNSLRARHTKSNVDNRETQKRDPRYNPQVVETMRNQWNQMRRARSAAEWNADLKAHPEVARFMKSRAGILPMTMEDYLFKHPMSKSWPTPPRTEQELQSRMRQGEDYLNSIAKARQQQEQDYQPDNGPGWGGG